MVSQLRHFCCDSLLETFYITACRCVAVRVLGSRGEMMSKAKKALKKTTKKSTSKTPAKKTAAKKKPKTKKAPAKKATKKPAAKAKKPAKKSASMVAKPKKKATPKAKKKTKGAIDKEMLDELALEVQSEDEQVALGAIERIAEITGPTATGLLVLALKDDRYLVRIHVAAELGERKDKAAVGALIDALRDESLFVRQTVAGSLENIGGAKATKAITIAEEKGLLLDKLPEGRRLGSLQ